MILPRRLLFPNLFLSWDHALRESRLCASVCVWRIIITSLFVHLVHVIRLHHGKHETVWNGTEWNEMNACMMVGWESLHHLINIIRYNKQTANNHKIFNKFIWYVKQNMMKLPNAFRLCVFIELLNILFSK